MSEPSACWKQDEGESNGGGGGSRTRVRRYLPEGLYMRIRFCFLMPGVRKRLKTAGHQTSVHLAVGRRAAVQPPACLMASGPQPPGEVGADAHSLIKLRERTDYPQLRDIPSDLRVNGARHASRESLPPSKPYRPHEVSARVLPFNCTTGRADQRVGKPTRFTRSAYRGSTRSGSTHGSVVSHTRQSHCSATPRRSQSMAFSVLPSCRWTAATSYAHV